MVIVMDYSSKSNNVLVSFILKKNKAFIGPFQFKFRVTQKKSEKCATNLKNFHNCQ
jgi:hypothetical protein